MKKYLILAAGCALSACTSLPAPPASPSEIASQSVLDEKAAIAVEQAYRAARTAIETATDAGMIRGATATKAAALDNQAYAAVQAVRAAYKAGNASGYGAALDQARTAIASFLAVVKG